MKIRYHKNIKYYPKKALHCYVPFMITFPDLRSELFGNLLGYKEPDRVTLMRCRNRPQVCGPGRGEEVMVMVMTLKSERKGEARLFNTSIRILEY